MQINCVVCLFRRTAEQSWQRDISPSSSPSADVTHPFAFFSLSLLSNHIEMFLLLLWLFFFFCGSTMWLNTHLVSASEMASICTLSCFCPRRGGERGVVVAGHWYWPSNATKEIQKSSKINKQTKCLQSFHLLTYHFVLLIVVVVVSIAISCYCCCCCYSWWCRCR